MAAVPIKLVCRSSTTPMFSHLPCSFVLCCLLLTFSHLCVAEWNARLIDELSQHV